MKVLYDHQIFSIQKYGGISRYFYELIREIEPLADIETKAALLLSNNHYIQDKQHVAHFSPFENWNSRGKHWMYEIINEFYLLSKLKNQKFDIFHPTYYDPYFLNHIGNKPFVLTVYDMIHEKFSDLFRPHDRTSSNKKILAQKASKIIAISENTKRDLVELFDIDSSKIEVVYLGNSLSPTHKHIDLAIPHSKYILFVGSRRGYKNFEHFIKAIAPILSSQRDLTVVCAGGGAFSAHELLVFRELHIGNQVFQYNLTDDTLASFYQNALVFVFPSLYEGFGIPVLESFACQCPLLCSGTSSLPEIAGDGALYFDPCSEISIYETVSKALGSEDIRQQLIAKGTERLRQFSWKQTAEQTLSVYKSI